MLKKIIPATIIFAALFFLLIPLVTHASVLPCKGPLVPCGRDCTTWNNDRSCCIKEGPGVTLAQAQPCNLCHFIKIIQCLLSGFGIAILAWASIYILIGGIFILSSGGSPNQVSQGKKMITYAIIGMVIVLGSWLIVNTIMNTLVSKEAIEKKVFPWPWNRIECKIPESCAPGDGDGGGEDKRFCICQANIANGAYTIVKSTELSNSETCTQECNINKSSTYCDVAGSGNTLSCKKGDYINNTQARCLKPTYNYERVGSTCYSTPEECVNAILNVFSRCQNNNCQCFGGANFPGQNFPCQTNQDAIFIVTQKQNQYAIGICASIFICNETKNLDSSGKDCLYCALGTGGCAGDTTAPSTPTNLTATPFSSSQINLSWTASTDNIGVAGYRIYKSGVKVADSTTTTYSNTGLSPSTTYAYTVAAYDAAANLSAQSSQVSATTLSGGTAQWCQRSAPSGSDTWVLNPPPGGADSKQKGDASPALTSFLNCMYTKISNLKINSISSNILCSNGSCDITGYNCGHTANSCHFGGTSTNCKGESYAVDFDTNIACSTIKTAAQQCNSTAWVNWETNHVHVSVNNVACGCAEGATPNPCP